MTRKAYPTDLTDKQWNITARFFPLAKKNGRQREVSVREILNAILYIKYLFKYFSTFAGSGPCGCPGVMKMFPKDF